MAAGKREYADKQILAAQIKIREQVENSQRMLEALPVKTLQEMDRRRRDGAMDFDRFRRRHQAVYED